MRILILLLMGVMLSGMVGVLATEAAEESTAADANGQGTLLDHFKVNFKNLTYGKIQKPAESVINDDNRFEVPRYTLESDFRPDFLMEFSRLEALVKPRWDFTWEKCEDGVCEGDENSDENAYINEWLIRVEPVENLFFSYGREDLQWGPSYLLSPSNPFYTDNGRYNPKMEVAGADYARVVWSPNMQWAGSFIVNTDEGRKELWGEFHKTYALKVDYTAENGYFSLILAQQETEDSQVGFFASWNINDAFVAYTEDSVRDGEVEALVGGSYTLTNGSTFTLEYFHNGAGERNKELLDIFAVNQGPNFRMLLNRQNYLLLQYYYRDMLDSWNGLLRCTLNVDDDSAVLLGQMEYNLAAHTQLFASGTLFSGDKEDEFGGLLDYRAMAGLEFSF